METFKFNGKVDDQFDEFRKFVNCLKDKNKVEIILVMNEELTLGDIQAGIEKIKEILPNTRITIALDFEKIIEE